MSILPRLQLIELHEQPWMPASLRSDLQIGLSVMVRTLQLYKRVMVRVQQWMAAAEIDEILDLCSGAGGPALTLVEACLQANGTAPQVILSDLYPQQQALDAICTRYPSYLRCAPHPVNATAVGDIGKGADGKARARSLIACFHHFPPTLAKQMLYDAMEQRAPVLILEPMTRSTWALLSAVVGSGGLVPLLRLLQGPRTPGAFARLPINAGQCLVDGLVSVMRTYSPLELYHMAELPGSDYHWEFGTDTGIGLEPLGALHKITYGLGTPRERLVS